jgi:hypothetical protein
VKHRRKTIREQQGGKKLNRAGPDLGYNREYTVSSIMERYTTHIVPRLAIRPDTLSRKGDYDFSGGSVSNSTQLAQEPPDSSYLLDAFQPWIYGRPNGGNLYHSAVGAQGIPRYSAAAQTSTPGRAEGTFSRPPPLSGPVAVICPSNMDAPAGDIPGLVVSASEAAALEEAAEAVHTLIRLQYECLDSTIKDTEETENLVTQDGPNR